LLEFHNEERWHWSFKPLAHKFLVHWNKHFANKSIDGFLGASSIDELSQLQNTYVNNVDTSCK